ncbi:MAG: PEP-CTERM sorting domain-containing protein [Deltaproteobacteria bacterium]|nr:PEP-CTERM sorting domain-containing protein [Deltaproteobacteria bacterium]
MRRLIFAVMLICLGFSAMPASAITWTAEGTDVYFIADNEVTLDPGADGRFEFAGFTINGSGTVDVVESLTGTLTISSSGDIIIDGRLDALGLDLILESEGTITLNGSGIILGDSVALTAVSGIVINGELQILGSGSGSSAGSSGSAGVTLSAGTLTINSGAGIRDLTYNPDGRLVAGELRPLDPTVIVDPGQLVLPDGGTLTLTPVPEPSTFLLLGVGLIVAVGVMQRRSRS